MADAYVPRFRNKYDSEIAAAMTEKFGYKNKFEIPRIDKITLNMGVGEGTQDKKKVQVAAAEMELIAGQKPVVTKAKKSVAQFKLREGMAIGCKVTLRRERMYEFLDRLITIAMPRIRDFPWPEPEEFRRARQLCDGSEGADHLSRDQLRPDREGPRNGHHHHTTAKTDDEARELLRLFGFPFPQEAADQQQAA